MAQDQRACYLALIVLQDYPRVDNRDYDIKRVKCRLVETKTMQFQVECVVVLANGDIAISGGPFRFEVLVYRHDLAV